MNCKPVDSFNCIGRVKFHKGADGKKPGHSVILR